MGNTKSKNVLLTIMGVLIVFEFVARLITIQQNFVSAVAQLIILVFVALYCFWLYKKPHGNLLKYAMLLFAVANIFSAAFYLATSQAYCEIAKLLACAALCYCAGRLNRIEQNKVLFPIIAIVFLIISIYYSVVLPTDNIFVLCSYFNFTITFITLVIAYFVRFKEHKEAGLMDAPKK